MDENRDMAAASDEFLNDYIELYENAPDMCLSTDMTTGLVIKCNETMSKVLGYPKEEIVGKHLLELYHPDCHEHLKANIPVFQKTGQVMHDEMKIAKKSGEILEVSINVTPVFGPDDMVRFSRTILRDITHLKDSQRRLKAEKERSEQLLLNILPGEIAEELMENGSVKPRLYESVTVMFADFVGFSRIAGEVSPDDLVSKLDGYFSMFDAISEKHDLEKLKTIGDAYMCASGIPVPNPDHAVNTCLAALEMRAGVRGILNASGKRALQAFDVRIGINTGPVVAGVIGKKKFAYDVWGDAVNLASRLESGGMPGKINISKSTYELVQDRFRCEYRGEMEVKNMGRAAMYFLEG